MLYFLLPMSFADLNTDSARRCRAEMSESVGEGLIARAYRVNIVTTHLALLGC